MKKLVTVTERHINNGIINSRNSCPVALALEEQIPGCKPWVGQESVSFGTIFVNPKPLPRSAKRFIRKFDRQGKRAVKPFRFYQEVSDAS